MSGAPYSVARCTARLHCEITDRTSTQELGSRIRTKMTGRGDAKRARCTALQITRGFHGLPTPMNNSWSTTQNSYRQVERAAG